MLQNVKAGIWKQKMAELGLEFRLCLQCRLETQLVELTGLLLSCLSHWLVSRTWGLWLETSQAWLMIMEKLQLWSSECEWLLSANRISLQNTGVLQQWSAGQWTPCLICLKGLAQSADTQTVGHLCWCACNVFNWNICEGS